MTILITDSVLKRLVNFNNVIQQKCKMAAKHQWRCMTLENMQAYQQAQEEAKTHAALAGYGLYLYKVQKGLGKKRPFYGEPLLHNALLCKMQKLRIPVYQLD
ncbi:MAG: hypothetical protein BA871_07840 [Desulfuromonadales bacterium C00003096]|nr:MAG: hypothetical protein BA871_07840 [Desulfuromonadales bacterium C00003096]